jgi:hypothetical protein
VSAAGRARRAAHGLAAALALALCAAPAAAAAPGPDAPPLAAWRFEDGAPAAGRFRVVAGVSGRALRLDGFTTRLAIPAAEAPRLAGAFSIDAWVALAAYPWNWCPILAQERDGDAGYFFGIGPRGELGLRLAVDGRWLSLESQARLPLRRFTHVAVVFDPGDAVRLYVDGSPAGRLDVRGALRPAPAQDLVIGANRAPVMPSDPVPPAQGTRPSWFSLDGILDELRLHGRALGTDEIARAARPSSPPPAPDLPPRVMPSGPAGPGRFGAYYTKLRFYEEWDALWPVAEHPDVVVQFDASPVRVVFWRGLRYSPAWVTENGLWLADQSMESGNHEGCVEHMQDVHAKYSHVRIVESSPARVVVHWRYAPVSGHDNLWLANERSGWDWWVDEYYTFLPDGTGVRKVRWRNPEAGREFPWLQIQETSVLCHPGQHAKDVLKNDALTLLDLHGASATYSWPDDATPDTRARRNMNPDPSMVRDVKPRDSVIQVVNMRSEARPFAIFEPGTRPRVYVGRVRDEVTRFPAYNHWPASQVRSDGRFAQAADRATSFSISQNYPPRHAEADGFEWVAILYGATFGEPSSLVPLARSWIHPPELTVRVGDAEARGYDIGQRAYTLRCRADTGCGELSLELAASGEQPLRSALLVLEGWGERDADLWLDGRRLEPGRGFRVGRRHTLEGADLLLWLEHSATTAVSLRLAPRAAP